MPKTKERKNKQEENTSLLTLRIMPQKIPFKGRETILPYSSAGFFNQVVKEIEVMETGQHGTEDLPGFKKMAQISAAVFTAYLTAA
jgi:hypothetical protein